MPVMTDEDFMTYVEAARRFGKSVDTIRSWVNRRVIRSYKKPLVRTRFVSGKEIEDLLNAPPRAEGEDDRPYNG